MSNTYVNTLDLLNSEIAFRDKTNAELRQTYQLFRVMNNNRLVKTGQQLINIAFVLHLPIEAIIKKTIYKQFVGGTSIDDCANTIQKLAIRNVGTILDYALEGEADDQIFDATCKEIIRTVEFAHENRNIPFSAFKITGIGRFDLLAKVSEGDELTSNEKSEFSLITDRVNAIFKRGYEMEVPILIDAEETWIQPVIDKLVLDMMFKYNREKAIVQNTYQMYRIDSIDRLKYHHKITLDKGIKFGLKIVRGAYMEKERERAATMGYPSPIQPDKKATDHDFNAIIHYFMENVDTIDFMVATHNEESTKLLASLIDEKGLSRNHPSIYFSQLYGMSDNLTYNLAANGFNVVKYVPYGEVKTMMPYLFRRAEENSSVKGQSSRELNLIRQEIKRRKEKK